MHKILKSWPVLVLSCIFLFSSVGQAKASPAQIVYVKWNAPGPVHDGTSWTNAYTSLQTALTAAVSGYELWVAGYVTIAYKPTTDMDRTKTFTLKNGVALYGGFNGSEDSRSERDPSVNITRLSGDIGNSRDWADNSYHVVTTSGLNSTAVLDGFSILYGNANGTYPDDEGGGIYNLSGSPTLANLIISGNWAMSNGGGMYNYHGAPTLTDVTFDNNRASAGAGLYPTGGGMYNDGSSPVLTNVIFSNNLSTADCGGMFNGYGSNPVLTNVIFSHNSTGPTGVGGGMLNYQSSPTLTNATFEDNSASNGGGMDNYNTANPILTNVTFNGNSAGYRGGGMHNLFNSSPILTNVTFSGNTAPADSGGGMYNAASSCTPLIKNSLFWGNGTEIVNDQGTPVINDSLIQGGCPAHSTCNANIVITNPLLGGLANNGGFTQTMALPFGSSAIDKGNNATCAPDDQRGVSRPQDGDLNVTAICDMGAYEFQPSKLFLPLIKR